MIDELVPCVTADTDDIVIDFLNILFESHTVAHELPEIFHRFQFRGPGWKRENSDILRKIQLLTGVLGGLIN